MQKNDCLLGAENWRGIPERLAEHILKMAATHGGHGMVNDMAQGALALLAIQALKNFKVAFGQVIDDQASGNIQGNKWQEMFGAAGLGLVEIAQKRAAGPRKQGLVVKPEGGQIPHALADLESSAGASIVKIAQIQLFLAHIADCFWQFQVLRHEKLGWGKLAHPLPNILRAPAFQAAPFAGGNIGPGKGRAAFAHKYGTEEIVPSGLEIEVVEHGAWRDDLGYGAFDNAFGCLWIFCLLADGNGKALVHKRGYVALGRMPGHAAHRRCPRAVLAALGQHYLQLA